MYPSPQELLAVQAAEKIMVDTMAKYDPSHDAFHVQRVRRTALSIAREISKDAAKPPDSLVVELAALLHDVLDKKYVSAEVAADPYAFFRPFFQSVHSNAGIDLVCDGRALTIAKIVDNVSWSTEKKRRQTGEWGVWHDTCLELHCVQDADRLDAIGAFGILRYAAYSTATKHALHTPPDDALHRSSAIQHFHDKLLHIKDRLKTVPGKRMGDKRHQVMLDFLASVEEECNSPSS